MKTHLAPVKDIDRKWYVVDAEDLILGRMASEIATRLRGKHKPIYSTFMDTGDFVVVLNADKVKLTGNKWSGKVYYRHTGYIGGIKAETAEKLRDRKPEELVYRAVKGMLPKNPLGRKQLKKLKVYAGSEHPHQAQQPEPLKF
ncbi:50S ribosomal protein L13 [Desulfurivibrio dismutans]|uniref:50S ribosomal protein L13 n=1 Tax=Desulfurivibrio dismutans TaxID=1398908 RepID=UPI0023DB0886|nr:50S ribosomal protein L13 [Desulfurivibrio alkaliphilus]MDF1614572.1 50S ribosomal protein L13 [Desulfurivibrio alkaliphilus]